MNCREINERLILGMVNEELGQLIQLLEIGDPDLPMLSPLAKAAWRLQSSGSVREAEVEAALKATIVIAGQEDESLLSGESICSFEEEKVVHRIPVKVTSPAGTRIINLSFESEGNLQCTLGGDAPLTPWLTVDCLAHDWGSIASDLGSLSEQSLFPAYERYGQPSSPGCYPCDTYFIGMPTYSLLRIEDQPVSGPILMDAKHDIDWVDYGLLEKEPSGREFCWLHQLTLTQAQSLGLARSSGKHPDPKMPEWLADDLTFSKLWIDPDDLQESYSQGHVTGYKVADLLLCVGAGPEWCPGDLDSQVDELNRELDQIEVYPEAQLPLKVFRLSKGYACDDPDLGQVLHLLDALVRVMNASD